MSRLRRLLDRIELTSVRAAVEFVDDRAHRDAAQIAYFALLSFIPLGLLLVGAFGLVFDDTEVRERVVNTVFDNVPLARGEDRQQLERTVGDALDGAGNLGGDEFCVLAPQTGQASADRLTARVRGALAGVTAGLSGLSASIGTAVFPADGSTPEALLAMADLAALEAKRRSRSERPRRQAA